MSDIFLSYSSLDKAYALDLAKDLHERGHQIWLDQLGISGAMNWSSEIVEAINKCSTMILLISSNSATSHNCAKEVHLASEKQKNILPVILEDTSLPVIFEYPLAGLQRVKYRDRDKIDEALRKLQSGKSALAAMATISPSIPDDGKLHLAVIPFDDLSPTHDNDWFADGMTDELIGTIGSLDNFIVNPRNDVIYYKSKQLTLHDIANDLGVRYVVGGSVQKVGERIRIRVSLSDAKVHKQIWSEKYDGTFDDVFDLQDQTVRAITDALKVTLSSEEQQRIDFRPTNNTDAYQLHLRGQEYHAHGSKSDLEHSLELFESAVALDPSYIAAYLSIANTGIGYYRYFSRTPETLERIERALAKAEELDGRSSRVLCVRSMLSTQTGHFQQALEEANESLRLDPKNALAYAAKGFAHKALGQWEEVALARERLIEFRTNSTDAHFSLVTALKELDDPQRLKQAAERAIPVYQKYLRLNPDSRNSSVEYVNILDAAGRTDEALSYAEALVQDPTVDAVGLYNLACFFAVHDKPDHALDILKASLAKGFKDYETIAIDRDLSSIRGLDEFKQLIESLH